MDRYQKLVWLDRAIICALAALLFLPMLGAFGLWDPWETHYGEVGRQLTERNDWISTWWGSHWKNGQGGVEGKFFFSKPILLMWLMAIGLEVFGFGEIGIRLGITIIAMVGVVSAYSMGERIWGRRAGWLFALVLATSPFFAFLSRQAQTDMPFVGNMTIGMCFYAMAMFGRDREKPATRLLIGLTLGFLALITLPQITLIATGLATWRGYAGPVGAFFLWGPTQAAIYVAILAAVVGTTLRGKPTQRQLHLYTFYAFIGLATLAKGLLGFLLPGAIIFFHIVLTGQWRSLARVELLRGAGVFITVAFPWYVAMLVRHGNAYYQRFFIHDHFKRLATGVHQIDSGSFEHYIKWLGFGLWPWIGLVPAAALSILGRQHRENDDPRQRAALFFCLWAIFTFTLFTLSSTKFHHYIFPAVPACCFLVGVLLYDMTSANAVRARIGWIFGLAAFGLVVLLGWDIFVDPQHLKNLFTYKYDRKWDAQWTTDFRLVIGIAVTTASIGAAFLAARTRALRVTGISIVAVGALVMTAWGLWVYMPTISTTWSQKGVWDRYYELCTRTTGPPGHDDKKRYCEEQSLSYKLNWRGETYYTQNEVLPIREDHEFNHFLSQNGDRPFFAIMEMSRYRGEFQRNLPTKWKKKSCLIDTGNIKFAFTKVPCAPDDPARSSPGTGVEK
jgi:4-amino-4-deoxy-L-arabinose transferase-like glycosyltransferase